MRLFLAINLPERLKKRLFKFAQNLKGFGRLKLVEENNIHLTLKFLGEAGPEPLIAALRAIQYKPFMLSLRGVGVFPNPDYIRVVWAGCEKGAQDVITLHNKIEEILKLNDFKKDKDFHPHATLARVKFPNDKRGLVDFIRENQGMEFGEFKVESFELMKSELSRAGPRYELIEGFLL